MISAISCVISAISCVCVCVVSAVNDGNCSLRWSATVSVVQESMWWKGNQIRDITTIIVSRKSSGRKQSVCFHFVA